LGMTTLPSDRHVSSGDFEPGYTFSLLEEGQSQDKAIELEGSGLEKVVDEDYSKYLFRVKQD